MFEFLRQVNAAHHGDGGVRSDDGDPGYSSGEGQPRLRDQWGWTHGRDPLPAGRLIRAWHADTTGVGRGTTSSSPMPTLSTHANIFGGEDCR